MGVKFYTVKWISFTPFTHLSEEREEYIMTEIRELTNSELDVVTGGQCKIGEPGMDALRTQLQFFVSDPPPPIRERGLEIFTHANTATGGCIQELFQPPS